MKMASQEMKAYNWTFASKEEINLDGYNNNLQYIIYRSKPSHHEGFVQLRSRGDKNDVKRIIGNNTAKVVVLLTPPLPLIELFQRYSTSFDGRETHEVGTFMDKDLDDICSYALSKKTRDEAFEILKREAPSLLFAHWSDIQGCLDHFFSDNQK